MNGTRDTAENIALIVGGVAAGILGSRLLPPLIASATASARARRGGDPFDLLISDHREILSMLDDMAQQPADSTGRRLTTYLMFKRKLAKHAMAEEDVVYPILHSQGQDPQASKHLYDEHADMKIALFEMEESLKNGTDWKPQVQALRQLIASHAREEEEVVFPRLRDMLSSERKPKVSGLISREEALVL